MKIRVGTNAHRTELGLMLCDTILTPAQVARVVAACKKANVGLTAINEVDLDDAGDITRDAVKKRNPAPTRVTRSEVVDLTGVEYGVTEPPDE